MKELAQEKANLHRLPARIYAPDKYPGALYLRFDKEPVEKLNDLKLTLIHTAYPEG